MRRALVALVLLAGCAPLRPPLHTPDDAVLTAAPSLVMRASPIMPMTGQRVLITAELVGREDERFYCPRVRWEMPDGTAATEESDCEPYVAGGEAYQRRWTRVVTFGAPGAYTFEIRLERAGRMVMRQTLTVEVRG